MNAWPLVFRSSYAAEEMELTGQSFLLVFSKIPEVSPSTLEKQLAWIQERAGQVCIFVTEAFSAYNRKRLIERGIPFIVPGNQMYLPGLGLDLREHLRQPKQVRHALSPSSQLLLLWHCLHPQPNSAPCTASVLAERFGYSKMTMGRALDELENLKLVERIQEGRQKQARFLFSGQELWEQSKAFLQNPVKRRLYFEGNPAGIGNLAGESALSERSMLAAPHWEVRAILGQAWSQMKSTSSLRPIPEHDRRSADLELELWSYDPKLLSDGDPVDALSLILSFTGETDERIEGELQDVEEALPWS